VIGGLIALSIFFLVVNMVRPAELNPALTRAYNRGALVRILGTVAYLYYAYNLTGGSVDAFIYDNWARRFADLFLVGDFSPFTNEEMYRGGQFFYTNFVAYPAAFFLIITFDSPFGMYLLFSTACFVGLVFMVKAFFENYPNLDKYKVMTYTFLFPAVWFWTSTIGKDAFVFLGMGILCLGFNRRGINYFLILIGLAIVYAFRPPVAYMVIFSLAALFIFNINDTIAIRLLKVSFGLLISVYLLDLLGEKWRILEYDLEAIAELQDLTLRNNDYGTGALEEKSGGIASIPRGIVDVLARPFIWESRDITTFLAAVEINFMVLILLINIRSVGRFLGSTIVNKFSTFLVSFVLIYVVSTGIFENNVGLIARHRSILFPFLFLMAYGYAAQVVRKKPLKQIPIEKAVADSKL
jgi:hypothetical protein